MLEAGFFQGARLRVGAIENGEVGEEALLFGGERANGAYDVFGFLSLVFRLEDGKGLAARLCGPEFFVALIRILGNDASSGIKNYLSRAVVLIEGNNHGFGIVFFEVEDISDIRLAPAVNRLVVVADREEVSVAFGERVKEGVLGVIGILVFVDEDKLEKRSIAFERFREFTEEANGLSQEIVEIKRVIAAEFFLVASIGFCDQFFEVASRLGFEDEFINELILGARDGVKEGARVDIFRVYFKRFHHSFHQRELIVAVENGKRRLVSQSGDVFSENSSAYTMECADVRESCWE